jgi:hypothetical protein
MKHCLVLALTLSVMGAHTYHDGDLIFGGISGQCRIVDPTDLLAIPRTFLLRYYPSTATAPAFYAGDVGFDYFDEPGLGIDIVTDTTLTPVSISRGLRAADSLNTYFFPGATRQSFRLRNASRHKHFSFFIYASEFRNQRLSFRFKLTSSWVGSVAQADSPTYTIHFEPQNAPPIPFLPPVRTR